MVPLRGWFHSGDSATVDEQGLRIMVDRYEDIVKTGGENVSSMRVEAVLWAIPTCCAPQPGAVPAEADMLAFCRERLAGFETPERVVVADVLPETVGGKVLTYKLRAEHALLYSRA